MPCELPRKMVDLRHFPGNRPPNTLRLSLFPPRSITHPPRAPGPAAFRSGNYTSQTVARQTPCAWEAEGGRSTGFQPVEGERRTTLVSLAPISALWHSRPRLCSVANLHARGRACHSSEIVSQPRAPLRGD
jgi:hypothetical protein